MDTLFDSTPQALEVLLGPARSGKSAACLERFRANKGHALLLVPSREYADRLRLRLAALDEEADLQSIVPFSEVARDLAKTVWRQPEPIRRPQQWLFLSDLFQLRVKEDSFFGRMLDAPGFVPALADAVRELKLSGISPEDLEGAATILSAPAADEGMAGSDAWLRADSSFHRKIEEIAALYGDYQRFLTENGLLDEEEIYRLAIEAAPKVKDGRLAPRVVLVDGFYRLSRLWRDLLAALARRGAHVVVTLPADRGREVLFATPLRTLDALRQEFEVQETWLSAPSPGAEPGVLGIVERNLYASAAPSSSAPPARPGAVHEQPSRPSLLLFDAPNPYAEAEMVARAVVREHTEAGTPWSSIALIVRSVGDYAPLLSGVLSRYGVPYALRRGKPLPENAGVRALDCLLRIYRDGWQRDDVIAFLRCDRISAPGVGFDFARVQARSKAVRQGRAAWIGLLPDLEKANAATGDTLRVILELEEAFPPGPQSYESLAHGVREAVTRLGLDSAGGNSQAEREDKAAIVQALGALDQIVEHAALAGAEPVGFPQFHRRLVSLWRAITYNPVEPRDAIAIIEPYDAQQLRPRAAFVMGLTERVFPRRIVEDPFFRDDEREMLRRSCELGLEPQHERADDERLLFYMAIVAPTERLILSFPRSTEESDTLPSFFLDEVRAALAAAGERLPAVVRTLADVAPSLDECVTDHDRLLAACAAAGEDCAAPPTESDVRADVRAILETRDRPPAPALSPNATVDYGAPHRYSVTEIETYNLCPLQHFFRFGLKLRADADGAGAADRGSLHHDSLRRTLRAAAAAGEAPDRKTLRDALVRQMVECMNERTIDARPHRRELMARAVEGALEVCAEREERYRDLFGMTPTHFELAFGMEETLDEEGRRREYDPASTVRPLIVPDEDGSSIQLCGAIDRVDVAPDGRTAMVIDYKTGSTKEWAEIKEGASIQIPVYLMAVEQVWEMAGAVGCYDSPRDNGRRRFFRTELVDVRAFQPVPGVEDGRLAKPVGTGEYQEAVTAACGSIRRAVAGMRSGRITPTPGQHCRWCDFADICRTSLDGTHDGEPLPSGTADPGPREASSA